MADEGIDLAARELTFDELSNANLARAQLWHPGFPTDNEWTIADWSNAMCGEAGELANVIKKLRRWECGLRNASDPTWGELTLMAGEEIADVITYADLLAQKLELNTGLEIRLKFNKVSDRHGFNIKL